MASLATILAGYLLAILVGRSNLRAAWVRYGLLGIVAAVQVAVVLLFLFSKEPPNLERP